jgi:hypothetical protein
MTTRKTGSHTLDISFFSNTHFPIAQPRIKTGMRLRAISVVLKNKGNTFSTSVKIQTTNRHKKIALNQGFRQPFSSFPNKI